ncbi:RNAse P Rpr2/Rpp21/SNM1 subunit domain-containing protein [Sporodiniella umbellata]|nr:RNAse P Rpr2/Rpp21/SNM1 subunit domain-containing protein [Sporodiniella umbellata]
MGKQKKTNINPKSAQAYERINFLHQASALMSSIDCEAHIEKKDHIKNWQGDPTGLLGTSRYLNSNMKSISAKMVIRLDPHLKRTICKRCDTTLLPSRTSTNRIKSSPVTTLVTTCKICKTKKRFPYRNRDYELFNDKSESKD